MPENSDSVGGHPVEQLIALLSSTDHFARAEAARQLVNLGQKGIEALPSLLALHNDPWYQVRIQVPRAIIHMEACQCEAIKVLEKLLNDENKTVRSYAIEAKRVLVDRLEGTDPK